MVTKTQLTSFIKKVLKNKKIIVALNSEPYLHIKAENRIIVKQGSGGAQSLLDGILSQTGGTMVAVSSGDADKEVVNNENKILVPPEEKRYTLKRIFLTEEQIQNYYNGFSNQSLWPLFHLSFTKPIFNSSWWKSYQEVNQLFADAILTEADNDSFIWINDYQLCLLPQLLKEKNPSLTIGTFWHIPWPIKDIFAICPWRKEIITGMLPSDFIGFHKEKYIQNFKECATRELNIAILPDPYSIFYNNHITRLDAVPAGIDYDEIATQIKEEDASINLFKKDFGIHAEYICIGVDRMDHIKGLVERLQFLDVFFERYPEYQQKLVHVMISSPTRTYIPTYNHLALEVTDMIERINRKYATATWKPIHLINKAIERKKIFSYYHNADVCLVTSLDDGMNLVAKEFVICAQEDKGVLVLSQFTGATHELSAALVINPYDIEESVSKLKQALTMSTSEKIQRNQQMKKVLKKNNIYRWGELFLQNTLLGKL